MMPASSRSDSRKARKLDPDSFVTFDHAAAGHDGVRQDSSGSLIAKPCTAREIAFYESSVHHPAFMKYMPTFIGTLSSASSQTLGLDVDESGGPIAVTPSMTPRATDPSATSDLAQQTGVIPVSDPIPLQDGPWVPSGGRKLETGLSIVLENVTAGFKRPNVLDVKLGARLWADDSPLEKRARLDEVSRQTTSSSLGFRIAGMKVWVGGGGESKVDCQETDGNESTATVVEKNGYRVYDRWYGRSFNHENVKEGFKTFLSAANSGGSDHSKLVATRLAAELRTIQSILEAEESRMYSASILIVYEGDPEAFEQGLAEEARLKLKEDSVLEPEHEDPLEGSPGSIGIETEGEAIAPGGVELNAEADFAELGDLSDEEEPQKVHDVRLIDFAHASWTPGQGSDENSLQGIRSLVQIMDEVAEA